MRLANHTAAEQRIERALSRQTTNLDPWDERIANYDSQCMMVPHHHQSSANHSKNNLLVAIVRPVKPPIKLIDDTSTRVVFFRLPYGTPGNPHGF